MKVNFFSVTLLAALAIFETGQTVPLHTMSTNNTNAGLEVNLASTLDSGEAGKPVSFTLGQGETKTIDLTSTYTPKSDCNSCSKPVTKSCNTCKQKSGSQMESALSSLMMDTNNLTKALMDKMTKDCSKPDDKGCTLQDRLDNGFTLSLDNFEVGGLVPECKPAPEPKCECKSPATITIAKSDPCANPCDEKKASVTTTLPKSAPNGSTATKTAPTPAEKTADKTDALKKLEDAKR